MENDYGGPVWHASVAHHTEEGLTPEWLQPNDGRRLLHAALDGVGSATLGEWGEGLKFSRHLKRRVTDAEWGGRAWGMDYRKTKEGEARLAQVAALLPIRLRAALMEEVR